MEKNEKDYAAFAHLLEEEKFCLGKSVTFERLCSRIDADPRVLESKIIDELGCTGQSLVDFYRKQAEIPE